MATSFPDFKPSFLSLILLAGLSLAGCGGGDGLQLVAAGGTVKYQGKPVPGASVVYISDVGAQTAIGKTDDQGRFSLTTRGQDGAVVGSHKVAITAIELKEEPQLNWSTQQIMANEIVLIPREYGNIRTSELTAEVTEDPAQNKKEFDLE